ncbi:hypothetical protein GQ53DRAFT_750054 [Thozetella sp. PMI_491]|nr:hypothetical protein GQ53DRAFT_750054 [Thozetella sp. PMI_491]
MRLPHRSTVQDEALLLADEDVPTFAGLSSDLLIPGRGDPIKSGAIVIKDDKVDWVGPYADLPRKYADVKFTHVPVLMPGMWDLHTHFTGTGLAFGPIGDPSMLLPGANALAGAVVVADLKRTLEAGFTSVRELGGCAGYLWPGIRDGYLVGPNVYSSLTALSCTGGHGDFHNLPLCAVTHNAQHIGGICDGVDGCRLEVRNMVRQGARCIKVCSSGGVLSLNDDPEDRQYSDAELKAIVDEASLTGLTVAAHAIGKAGILSALRAGIRSIEHGCYVDDEVAEEMKKVGAVLVATRQIQEGIYADDREFAPIIRKKIEKIVPLTRENYRLAVSRGVKIALGTDSFSSDVNHRVSHGKNAMELVYAARAGLTPLQVIEACTATPPEVLGKKAPKTGQLKEGYDADVLGVVGSPLDDISILVNPDNITHVWKGGKLYKS